METSLNGHDSRRIDSFEGVHEGKGYGKRNAEIYVIGFRGVQHEKISFGRKIALFWFRFVSN